jgi:hypothetical protein
MNDRPFSRLPLKLLRMVHEHTCHFRVLGIFGFRCAEERLKRKKGGFDRQNGRPG